MTDPIIFQAMEDDFVEPFSLVEIESVIRNADSLALDTVYHFNIHLGRCSSDRPYGFFAYKAHHGFLVSLRLAPDSNHCAVNNLNFDQRITFSAGQHDLIVPSNMLVSTNDAVQCARSFCDSISLAPAVQWVRYEDLGFELYA